MWTWFLVFISRAQSDIPQIVAAVEDGLKQVEERVAVSEAKGDMSTRESKTTTYYIIPPDERIR